MEIKRRPFQGVLNILSFNRHYYIYGLLTLGLLVLSNYLYPWNEILFFIVVFAFTYGLITPLIISAFVYDFSGYYHFNWLKNLNLENSSNTFNLNINAGFDETSFILNAIYKKAEWQVFDFYNEAQHTEPAIVRARKVSAVFPNTQSISTHKIPLKDNSVDHIFLLSAIHEIRSHREKVLFLKECKRVCKPNGKVIMVEHLRSFPNFMAFTIGFTHFFSRKTWLDSLNKAGFKSIKENKFTPFMSIFICQ